MMSKTELRHCTSVEEARQCLESGADLYLNDPLTHFLSFSNVKYGWGCDYAVRARHMNCDIARLILQHGIDVNRTDSEGLLPIHYCDRLELLPLILETAQTQGAELSDYINTPDTNGESPLYRCALRESYPDATEFLVDHGAFESGQPAVEYHRVVYDSTGEQRTVTYLMEDVHAVKAVLFLVDLLEVNVKETDVIQIFTEIGEDEYDDHKDWNQTFKARRTCEQLVHPHWPVPHARVKCVDFRFELYGRYLEVLETWYQEAWNDAASAVCRPPDFKKCKLQTCDLLQMLEQYAETMATAQQRPMITFISEMVKARAHRYQGRATGEPYTSNAPFACSSGEFVADFYYLVCSSSADDTPYYTQFLMDILPAKHLIEDCFRSIRASGSTSTLEQQTLDDPLGVVRVAVERTACLMHLYASLLLSVSDTSRIVVAMGYQNMVHIDAMMKKLGFTAPSLADAPAPDPYTRLDLPSRFLLEHGAPYNVLCRPRYFDRYVWDTFECRAPSLRHAME